MISSRTRARSWYAKCGVAGPTSSSIASFVGSAIEWTLPLLRIDELVQLDLLILLEHPVAGVQAPLRKGRVSGRSRGVIGLLSRLLAGCVRRWVLVERLELGAVGEELRVDPDVRV